MRKLFGFLIPCSILLLSLRALGTDSAQQRPDPRPQYKSPLDVTVDEKGQTARVVLPYLRKLAVVDLVKGRVKEELPLKDWKPSEVPIHGSGGLDRTQKELDYYINRTSKSEGISLRALAIYGQLPEHALVVRRYAKSNLPATQVTQGWVFSTLVSLEPRGYGGYSGRSETRAALDVPNQGYADVSDVVVPWDERRAFVACAGSDLVLVLDLPKLEHFVGLGFSGRKRTESPFDLTVSRRFVIARIPTQANPRRLGLSRDGKTLVVSNHLADSLTVIDTVKLKVIRHISLGGPKPDAARRGEILFNSAKMTFHGQFTCASCHPNGHSDGLVWDLERDGIGNFKKTKSLLGVKDTAPYGWHSSSPTLADRVQGTLRTLHRHEPTKKEIADLVAYLESLPPPQPPPVKEADKPAVARGKAIFQDKGRCASCHKRAALDDGKTHALGLRGPTDTQDDFDTPSLRGVSRNAPYLHDGRAATLEEIFTKHNPKKRHGAAHLLHEDELADLMAYLKSL
jgi:YVTN family beta-propeller protein